MRSIDLVLAGLRDLGVRMWVKEDATGKRVAFKYPPFEDETGRKDLFKFIKDHECQLREEL